MSTISLDELVALNAEIAALARAGVPLEAGLAELGADLPGRLGRFASALAEKLDRGEPLDKAILSDAGELPPAYRAVIEAGVRAGRLPAALESVAASARRLSETAHVATITVLYPLFVVLTAWGGMVFFTCFVAPQLAESFLQFNVPGQRFLAAVAWAGRSAWYWAPIVPVLLLLLFVAWWLTLTRASMLQGRWGNWVGRRVPWLGAVLRSTRAATFLEVLALLIENASPLPDAIVLAAEASGDRSTLNAARKAAAALESGQPISSLHNAEFPPLVNWLLAAAGRDGALLPAVRHAAASYHRRAWYQSELLRVWMPIVLTLTVGGTVTAAYALSLFVPYAMMLHALAK